MTKRYFFTLTMGILISFSLTANDEVRNDSDAKSENSNDLKEVEVVEEEKEFYLIKQPNHQFDQLERYSLSDLIVDIYNE